MATSEASTWGSCTICQAPFSFFLTRINEPGRISCWPGAALEAGLFHGAVWLEYDKASYNYRWGGAQCPGKDLSETSVQILFAAFRSEYAITLEYVSTELKGKSYRCITGFSVSKS